MSNNQCVHMHVFADASMRAYGAVAYLLSLNLIDFVLAKSGVLLLMDTILPRRELRAAATDSCLAKFIVTPLHVQVSVRL